MALNLDQLGQLVVSQLTPDLLAPSFASSPSVKSNPTFGHCYVASEALYHLAGGKKARLRPWRLKTSDDTWHWWLVEGDGRVIDLTVSQFAEAPSYECGTRASFLSKRPSARARKVMARVLAAALRDQLNELAKQSE